MTSYLILVALLTGAILILGLLFDPEASFGYEVFATPLVYGLCGVFPNLVMYSKRELSDKELLIRKAIQLVLVEAVILFVICGSEVISLNLPVVLGIALAVLVIFVGVHGILWLQSAASAREMTNDLHKFQQKAS